jgi:hypothetical protein
VSADGRYVILVSAAPTVAGGATQVYRHDRFFGKTVLVSVDSNGTAAGNGDSDHPTISADGRIVVFESDARNLHYLDTDMRALP